MPMQDCTANLRGESFWSPHPTPTPPISHAPASPRRTRPVGCCEPGQSLLPRVAQPQLDLPASRLHMQHPPLCVQPGGGQQEQERCSRISHGHQLVGISGLTVAGVGWLGMKWYHPQCIGVIRYICVSCGIEFLMRYYVHVGKRVLQIAPPNKFLQHALTKWCCFKSHRVTGGTAQGSHPACMPSTAVMGTVHNKCKTLQPSPTLQPLH